MTDQRRDLQQRPSPEALLAQAQREESAAGKLKIFIGAAPGVGKTYKMLEEARAKRKDGVDVAVGVVETHGRAETEALLAGLEVIPRRRVDYRGRTLEEMDLDAIVARRPQLVLVDELAHTNAPGSRHPKRYLDVEELLANRIDVYTTVNVQHIESLNDVVAQITRVRIRETVPDSIFDRADAIELVDLTPDDLIQRLKEGKVYVPQQAERALAHYFSAGNLTALRELAQARGAEPVTIPGSERAIADDVIAFAQANNATQIVIGKSSRTRWFEILYGSVVHELVRRSGNISVHVIAGDAVPGEPIPRKTVRTAQGQPPFDPRGYLVAIGAVALALGVSFFINWRLGVENVDLVFLTAIVGVAVRYGLWPSLFASILASLCYNFFFLPPIYTFTIADPTNIAAFIFFIIMAVVVSNVAARVRTQALAAVQRARTTESLYVFSRKLAGVGTLDDVLWATAYQTALMLNVRVVLLLPENGAISVKAGYPPEDRLDDAALAAANWAWENNRSAGRGSDTLPGAKRLFLPMRTGRGPIGIIGIDSDKPGPLLTPDQRRLLDALMDQAALAIERVRLVADIDRLKRTLQTDRLRSALLTSISHDLKTPLAAVLAAAGTLRDLGQALDDSQKADLLATIVDESEG